MLSQEAHKELSTKKTRGPISLLVEALDCTYLISVSHIPDKHRLRLRRRLRQPQPSTCDPERTVVTGMSFPATLADRTQDLCGPLLCHFQSAQGSRLHHTQPPDL